VRPPVHPQVGGAWQRTRVPVEALFENVESVPEWMSFPAGNVLTAEPAEPEVWRVLAKCHDMRNRTEYEGALDVDERLVSDLVDACRKVALKVRALPPIAG
jgi:hypothetical protein